jgi:hypothetical protein
MEKEEKGGQLEKKNASLQKKLEFAATQINDHQRQEDDLIEEIKGLKDDKNKLEEENDRFRRQLGGRYGADGLKSQLDNISKALKEAHEENHRLKKKLSMMPSEELSASFSHEETTPGYSRGGFNSATLTQLRSGYEEEISKLHDELRELVMKNTAAMSDVQKAEQISNEKEKEIAALKQELTSMRLKLERSELPENNENSFYSQDNDNSFHEATFAGYGRDTSFSATDISYISKSRSQQRLDVDTSINSTSQSFSNSQNKQVLTPSKKHECNNSKISDRSNENATPPSFGSAGKQNVYKLHLQRKNAEQRRMDPTPGPEKPDAIVNFTQTGTSSSADNAPECQQS